MRRFVPSTLTPLQADSTYGPPPETLGRIGSLEVRLARSQREVKLAQALRFNVFYKEMSAQANAALMLRRRDVDGFDAICDHLLVIDHDAEPQGAPAYRGRKGPAVVGTYRLLRQEVAERNGGFYTSGEFEIEGLIERKRPLRFMELGRSCVLKSYRNKRTVELLWSGIWSYVQHYEVDVMLGCASLEGCDVDRLALPLSFLQHNAAAPDEWRVRAVPSRRVPMDRMPAGEVDMRQALNQLPPLVKGYLRLGAYVGDGAVVDYQFGTTDVLVVLPVASINPRYFGHFGAPKERAPRPTH
ncbi:GNAT family N-acetyltransferase [Lutibaculum baratangense]|nr:GNAT family N-acetyltransferase [Lutibaculum baratangense]